MFSYDLGLAWRSIRRNPALAALMVGGIAVGIAVASTFVTIRHVVDGNPIPQKSDQLFYVRLDSWERDRPFDRDNPESTPNQVTYRDMVALLASDIPLRKVGSCKTVLVVHPESADLRPYRQVVRLTGADFFPMFDVPFQYGSGWSRSSDENVEPVVVIDQDTNEKLFGGENSVGRTVRLNQRDFRVAGVMATWRPTPKFYDPHNGPYQAAESVYVPFGFMKELDVRSAGNTSDWGPDYPPGLDGLFGSEAIWLQLWVELPDAATKAAFQTYVDAYTDQQKALGRFQRPRNNQLQSVAEFMRAEEVVPEETQTLSAIALMFLVVSAVNLVGILLGKFLARAPEVGIRRALGASRLAVFRQHLLECELLALAGGAFGLVIAAGFLQLVGKMFFSNTHFVLDLPMLAAGIALALVAGLIAGVYPAWRICRVAPASYLKLQ